MFVFGETLILALQLSCQPICNLHYNFHTKKNKIFRVVSDSLTTWFTTELAMVFRENLILLRHDTSMGSYTYMKIYLLIGLEFN